jgi:hypothetical protein
MRSGQLLEQVEQGAVAPVDVLDDDDHRPVPREVGEEGAPGGVDRGDDRLGWEVAQG